MSDKRPRAHVIPRVLGGLVIGALATTLVVVYLDRRGGHQAVAPPPVVTATSGVPTALQGTFDVVLTTTAVEYGATWISASPRLTVGQTVSQQWAIDCRGLTCVINVPAGHVPEDPDGATVASTDGTTFAVSGTNAATADAPGLPTGCGTVNSTDRQVITLTVAGTTFAGRYSVHHPTLHVDGAVAVGTASCDSFNVVFDITARRH